MPKGELYIRRQDDMLPVNHSAFRFEEGAFVEDADGVWIDAYLQWGVSFSETALSNLFSPAPNKEPVENKSRTKHGKQIIRDKALVKKDERSVSLEMHITANSVEEFWNRYDRFISEVLDNGFLEIRSRYRKDKVFRTTYVKCTQFSEFVQQMAKFILSLNEPDPSDREPNETDN